MKFATVSERSGPSPLVHILVTDDRPEVLRAVTDALGDPYVCEYATDVDQVRGKLATGAFQLALCGVGMEGASGLTLAEEIVRKHPDTAVVLVTTEDDPLVASQAFGFGVYGYLIEPFWPGQLLITVMNALRRRELEIAGRVHSENLSDQRQKIIDMAPMPIYVKDTSYRYILANDQADALAGLGKGELVGKTDEAIMSPEALEATRAIDRELLETGLGYEAEETLTVGGVERTFKTVKFPLRDEAERITSICGISADVTDQHEAIRLRDELAGSQAQAIDQLWASHQETVDRFATAIRLHDASTGDHVDRMAGIVALLGQGLQLEPEQVRLLRIAAPMHDVGKIAISDEILRKPGPLTADERIEMQRHTTIGYEILSGSQSELLQVAARIALTHHERFDGTGYPFGLAGRQISIEGRISAVADVFDALLSDRCYRPAFSQDEALAMIRAGRDSQFDPMIVDTLVERLDDVLSVRA